jgi:membrane-bound metal-dependent hydrolase YbcI (DUF457 family)
MDPVTHGITGALLGKAFFRRRQGPVAVFAATLGAVFPDIDTVAESLSRDPLAIVKYHRGITHSYVALPLFAALLGWLTRLITRRRGIETPSWPMLALIYGVGLASHITLDGMTSFGTRMWTPLSDQRVAWDLLFIIDFTLTSIALVPQVIAWIYRVDGSSGGLGRATSRSRAKRMWILFSLGAVLIWTVTYVAGYPFRAWIVVLLSGILAALFFLPAAGGWGFRVTGPGWCQAGAYVMLVYLFVCAVAHHRALVRVKAFAEANHIAVERMGALPVPPSWLSWGEVIRSTDGVYLAQMDLRDPPNTQFRFVPDSPPDEFSARALELPEVRLYWSFARFPSIATSIEGAYHLVDFNEHRFTNGGRRSSQPFSYRVVFDSAGDVVEEGWRPNGLFLERLRRPEPLRADPRRPPKTGDRAP